MAVYQGQEPAIINANFLVDAGVELVVQRQEQVAFGGAVLRQVASLLRVLLEVIDFKVVVSDNAS